MYNPVVGFPVTIVDFFRELDQTTPPFFLEESSLSAGNAGGKRLLANQSANCPR